MKRPVAIHAQNSLVSEECLNLHRQFWRNVSGNCYIGNIFNATSPGGIGVFVNSNGKLGTCVSSRRFKDDIKPMDKISEAIPSLQLVTFHYKRNWISTEIELNTTSWLQGIREDQDNGTE
ncbi:MAG TPA: tail fiber domain-containing protein [Candidatus Udaeobacter sp.]|nr:tail fiber domain-containing protein [Candidatus Udaeobacter sp.]